MCVFVSTCVSVLIRVYVAVCKSVHTCQTVCVCVSDYACIAAGCMYTCQSAYLLTNQTHATCVCIVAVTLLLPKTHLHANTHTLVGIWAGICIGSTAPVSGIHTKRQRAVIQTQPLVCVCVGVMKGPSRCP